MCFVAWGVGACFGRPAEQGIGVQVPHYRLDDVGADVAATGGAGSGVFVCYVEGAGHEGCEGDEVVAEGLLCGDEEVPFEGYGGGEVGFLVRDGEDCFGGAAEGAGV